MTSQPMQWPKIKTVTVEYDCRGVRASKKFENVYDARRFYAEKYMSGKNPTLTAQKD